MTYALCLHRWVGDQARYGGFSTPPDNVRMHYLTTGEAVRSLPSGASFDVVEPLDEPEVSLAVERIRMVRGTPVRIVALNEADLLTAASLRERLGVSGDDIAAVEPFRDKLRMAQVATAQTGVRVLPTADVGVGVEQLLAKVGLPLVVKPRYGTASRGVRVVNTVAELREFTALAPEPMVAQEYCVAPTRHVDGWWDGTRIVVGTASVYTSNCAEFGSDTALGSFELPPGATEDRLLTAAGEVLAAFAPDRELVFHLELFDSGDELTFLEIAARPGGAEVPFIWRDLREIDLVGIAWELQTGWSRSFRDDALLRSHNGRPSGRERGGWVLARSDDQSAHPPTVYWSQGDERGRRRASGVYEGAQVRIRLRSLGGNQLGTDVRAVAAALSDPRYERSQK